MNNEANPFDFEDQSLQQIANRARDEVKQLNDEGAKRGWALIEAAGVKVGCFVTVEWAGNPIFTGRSTLSHNGKVTHMEGNFIYVSSSMRSVGSLHLPIAHIVSIKVDEDLSSNPFLKLI